MTDTLIKVTELIRDLFDEYEGPVTRNLTPDKVTQWDSLGNVRLLVYIERMFGVEFSIDQMSQIRSLGELVDMIDRNRTPEE